MITLQKYINESLLDDFDDIEKTQNFEDEILDYIDKYYGRIDRSKLDIKMDDKNGIYLLSYDGYIDVKSNGGTQSLTNGLFKWDTITYGFDCSCCDNLTSLEGAPEKCSGFNCESCDNLTSLKGAPKICKNFNCSDCPNLTSLEGAPKKVGGNFNCSHCISLKSLKGAPEICNSFLCSSCFSLTSLEGAPKKVGGSFNCSECHNLISLKGAPEKVNRDFNCSECPNLKTFKDSPKECENFIATHCGTRDKTGIGKVHNIIRI